MNYIKNHTFVLVGRMGYPRYVVRKEIHQRGGRVTAKVTASTDYLVCGVIHADDKHANQQKGQLEYATRLQKAGRGIQIMWPHDLFTMFADTDEKNRLSQEGKT